MKTHEQNLRRFWSFVSPEPNTGCWLWMGHPVGSGYGCFTIGTKAIYAHRYSYELFKAKIPEGLTIDHLCRVRCCVNPNHLEAVTMRVNALRGESVAAKFIRRDSCSKGHVYDLKNTRMYMGARICRICSNGPASVKLNPEDIKPRKYICHKHNFPYKAFKAGAYGYKRICRKCRSESLAKWKAKRKAEVVL